MNNSITKRRFLLELHGRHFIITTGYVVIYAFPALIQRVCSLLEMFSQTSLTDLFINISFEYNYVCLLGTNEYKQHVLVIRKYVVANTYHLINMIARVRLRQSMTRTAAAMSVFGFNANAVPLVMEPITIGLLSSLMFYFYCCISGRW